MDLSEFIFDVALSFVGNIMSLKPVFNKMNSVKMKALKTTLKKDMDLVEEKFIDLSDH